MKVNGVSNGNGLNFKSVDRVVVWSNKSGKWEPSLNFDENKRIMRLLIRRANGREADSVNVLHESSDVIRCLYDGNKDYKKDFDRYKAQKRLALNVDKMHREGRGESIANMVYDTKGSWKRRGQFLPISYLVTGKEQEELRKAGEEITLMRRLHKMGKCDKFSIEAKINQYLELSERFMKQAGENILHVMAKHNKSKPYEIVKMAYFSEFNPQNPLARRFMQCLHK